MSNKNVLHIDRRFHNQSIIKDDYFDGTEYSKYTHSPIDIIEDNDRMFNKTKTFIDSEIDILKNIKNNDLILLKPSVSYYILVEFYKINYFFNLIKYFLCLSVLL